MNDDALLRQYVDERSEAAFTELVRRHIGMVRMAALRRVGGDAHLADDVTQAVFISLARKAPALMGRSSLAGWLYLGTQLAAAAVVRAEQRRKIRETHAHTMSLTNESDGAADPAQLAPLLDDALIKLKDDEREAVVLRYFQKLTFAEIGAALRVTEEAARKRVDRALDKLHAVLTERGITSSVAALGVTLAAVGVGAAPEALIARVATASLSHVAAQTAAITATGIGVTALPWITAAAVALGVVAISTQRDANRTLAAEIVQLKQQNAAISDLRTENERIARAIDQYSASRATVAPVTARTAPMISKAVGQAPSGNVVTVTPQGALVWEGQAIRLDDYLIKVKQLGAAAPDEGLKLMIQANGSEFPQLDYTLEEARKAGVRNILVESDARLSPLRGSKSWF